jgi:hypothetical protein
VSEALPRLLRVLVEGESLAVARALHPRVVLRRLDASEVRGREAVMAAFAEGGDDARHSVLDADELGLRVELRVSGVPGALRFGLRGRVEAGRLIEVCVTAG